MWAIAFVVALAGALHAARLAWVTDDAFISFRYADNLVRGLGLVFNAGERVEGYSNFLWTLWSAAGIRLGFSPVDWSIFWGIACHVATLLLLVRHTASRHAGGARLALPVAAMLGALHRDWAIYATSGLETSSFTMLVVLGFVLLARPAPTRGRLAAAGAALGLAALSRPDGALFAGLGLAFVAATGTRRVRDVLAYALPVAALAIPYAAWKLHYYGDLLPNTYYAKSANRAWYSQGLVYVALYFRKYWVLAADVLGCAAAARVGGRGSDGAPTDDTRDRGTDAWNRSAVLAALFALVYTAYVAHVGGDFMYARLLIPVTPFYLVLLELAIERLGAVRPRLAQTAVLAAGLAVAFSPYPFHGQGWVKGIVNEWEFYSPSDRKGSRELGLTLRRYFDGLPIRMAFCGGQAVLAYYSRAPLAIETATGLTDSTIAHQPLGRRGRVGHEKQTPIHYLIERRTHFWTFTGAALSDTLAPYIPLVPLALDTLRVMVITWDPAVMEALRQRGARVEDFLPVLDRFIADMPRASDADVRDVYGKTCRFYFDHVSDPVREAPFRARLGLPPRPRT